MAASVTVTKNYLSADKNVLQIKLACVGESAGLSPDISGQVPDTVITDAAIGDCGGGYNYTQCGYSLVGINVVAGTVTAPDAADITINDAIGAQLYDANDIIPASGTSVGSVTSVLVTSQMTVIVENQGTADATWDIYLTLRKRS